MQWLSPWIALTADIQDMASLKGSPNYNVDSYPTWPSQNVDDKLESDLILLDFSKGINSVSHERLLLKLASY